jgi:TRAP-type C4-dicarboxylate transport system substrate-binding protein
MTGIKVRLASTPLLTDLYTGLGAEPRAMALADAHAALRAGTLDAQEGTLATIAAARLDTLGLKQVMLWGAVAECAVFAANRDGVERLDRGQRAVVRDAASRRRAAPRLRAPTTTLRASNWASVA